MIVKSTLFFLTYIQNILSYFNMEMVPLKKRYILTILFLVFLFFLIIYAIFDLVEVYVLSSRHPCQVWLTDTDGIRAVITALGAVCFALSYINSAKVKRVKGVLMEDIISCCYPFYGIVFLFHGVFAALGLFSSASGILRASCICLAGIAFCLTYSLWMAYQVCFSWKGRDQLVGLYIMDLLRHPFDETSKRISQAYQFGQYVGSEYDMYDICLDNPICRGKKNKGISIICSLTGLLMPDAGPIGSFPEAFPYIFSDADTPPPQDPQYILFALPCYDACREKFRKNIQLCSVLWENILSVIKTEERQAAFASEALLCSPSSVTLCCGLIHYLHSTYIQYHNHMGEEGWVDCAYFLARVSNAAKRAGSLSASKDSKKVSLCCRDMSIVFLCLAFMEEANSPETHLEDAFLVQILRELRANYSLDFCVFWDDKRLFQYLSFAYEVFLSLTTPGVGIPYRTEMYLQASAILERLQQCLNAK